MSTNSRPRRASTRWPSACATSRTRAPPSWCARPPQRPAGACARARGERRQRLGAGGDILFGQGFAYARYVHSKWPGFGAAWSAWVADVEVNRKTGEVHVRRVVVGHDAGLMVNPAGVEHQIHGNVIQTTSRALKEQCASRRRLADRRAARHAASAWSPAANGAATRSSTSAKCR